MKTNQMLIGIIIIMIGVFGVMRKLVAFDFRALTIMVIGLAFLLLYRQKKSVWPLFLGGYLTCIGFTGLLSWLGLGLRTEQSFAAMFFLVPGAIFMLLYFDKHKHALLTPACIMLWLGIGSIFIGMVDLNFRASIGTMGVCLGLSFCTAYIIGKSHLSRSLLHLGLFIIVLSALFFGGLINLSNGLSKLASYMLIAIGALIIIKSVIRPR